jgi:predicted alpha/beta-hydrolase family hydrolase
MTVSACVRVMVTVYPSDRATAGLVLAHGAGGGQQSSFMVRAAHELAARGVTVATFDFPYMAAGRSAPDRPPALEAAWRTAIDEARGHAAFARLPLFIGGKSMGGRIASQVAAAGVDGVAGLVFFGYPLHPPGRPGQTRDAHLPSIREPMLFVQGARDQFGTSAEIGALLPRLRHAEMAVIPDGDHSFKTRRKVTGRKPDAALADVFDAAAAFIARSSGPASRAPRA